MRLNFTVNSFVFGRISREIAPRTFSAKLQAENFWNPSEFHTKQLRFWMYKSRNCAQNFSVDLAGGKLPNASKLTANSYISGCINRENASRTFLWTSQGENLLNASELRRKQLHFWMHKSWNCAQNFITKLVGRKLLKCIPIWISWEAASFLDV